MSTSEEAAATATTTDSKKMISLESSDGQKFEIPELVAMESHMLKNMIEDDCASATIPLLNVTSAILAKVIEYCKFHVETPEKEEIKKFDKEFVKVEMNILFEVILAANYLNIKSLLELTCQTVADLMKCKTVEEIRVMFNVVNDYTPEEEAEVRKDNAWAFE